MKLLYIIMIIVLIGIIILGVIWLVKYDIPKANAKNECLKNIAKNICEEKGLYFLGTSYYSGWFFKCGEERSTFEDGKKFLFLDKEVKECGGK